MCKPPVLWRVGDGWGGGGGGGGCCYELMCLIELHHQQYLFFHRYIFITMIYNSTISFDCVQYITAVACIYIICVADAQVI